MDVKLENCATLKVTLIYNEYGSKLIRDFLITGTFHLPAQSLVVMMYQMLTRGKEL